MGTVMKIIIVIPAFNEEKNLGKVIDGIPKQIKYKTKTYKTLVVVVDDSSKDKTYEVAKKHGAVVLRHIVNSGAGAATRTGLRYAERNSKDLAYVVTIDADGQHAASDIVKVVNFAIGHKSAMVVGNRLHKEAKGDVPLHRTLGNKALGLVSRVLFNIRIKDTQSGLRLFKADVIPHISNYTIDRYGWATDMLWHAVRNNVKVDEVPISIKYSKETLSHGQSNWGVVDLILDLLWVRISE
jgi:glycosyltransferase involved in cell wall biosynthesis